MTKITKGSDGIFVIISDGICDTALKKMTKASKVKFEEFSRNPGFDEHTAVQY